MSPTLRIRLAAVLAGGLCLMPAIAHAQEVRFGSPQIKPIAFVETRADGTAVRRIGLEARIEAEPQAPTEALTARAKALFEAELRRAVEAVAGSDFAFVTFNLGPAVIAGREGRRTFRVIFVREGPGWRRLTRP